MTKHINFWFGATVQHKSIGNQIPIDKPTHTATLLHYKTILFNSTSVLQSPLPPLESMLCFLTELSVTWLQYSMDDRWTDALCTAAHIVPLYVDESSLTMIHEYKHSLISLIQEHIAFGDSHFRASTQPIFCSNTLGQSSPSLLKLSAINSIRWSNSSLNAISTMKGPPTLSLKKNSLHKISYSSIDNRSKIFFFFFRTELNCNSSPQTLRSWISPCLLWISAAIIGRNSDSCNRLEREAVVKTICAIATPILPLITTPVNNENNNIIESKHHKCTAIKQLKTRTNAESIEFSKRTNQTNWNRYFNILIKIELNWI